MFLKRVRKVATGIAVLALLAVVGYACIFNTFTLTRFVLPLISSLSGLEMKADYLDYVPFTGKVTGKNISIGPEQYPWFRSAEAHFTFDLTAALRGKYRFYDVWLSGGDFLVTQYREGWSFGPPPPIQETESAAAEQTAEAGSEDEETALELRNITLQNSTFNIRWGADRRKHGLLTMYNVSGYAEKFKKNRPFNGRLFGNVRMKGQKNNRIEQGLIRVTWHNQLRQDMTPDFLIWKLRLDKVKGIANGEPFENAALLLDFTGRQEGELFVADQLELLQTWNGEIRSKLDFKGDLSPQIGAARGEVRDGRLSPELVALASDFFYDINPGIVWVAYSGNFLWDQQQFNATGQFQIRREGDIIIKRNQYPLPPMDFDGKYDFRVHKDSKIIDLAEFRLRALSKGTQVAALQLRKPLKYRWKEGNENDGRTPRAVFDFRCSGLDMNLLKFVLPHDEDFQISSGLFFSDTTITCHSDLKAFDISGKSSIRSLKWLEKQNSFRQLEEIRFSLHGIVEKSFSVKLPEANFEIFDQNTRLGQIILNGNWDHPAGKSSFSAKLQNLSPELLAWYQQTPLAPEWKALAPGFGNAAFKGFYDSESNIINISGLSAAQNFGKESKLSLTADAFTCDFTENKMLENVNFNISAQGSGTAAAKLLEYCKLPVPAGGTFRGSARGTLARDLSWMLFDGSASIRGLSCQPPWQNVKEMDAESRFFCYFHNMKQLEFKKADLYIRRQNHPAMRLECPGTLDIDSGNYLGNWKVRYLNEYFLGMFLPLNGLEADFNGSLQLTLSEGTGRQKLVAALDCSKWKLPQQTAGKGKLSILLENTPSHLDLQHFNLQMQQAEKPFLHLSGAAKRPHNSSGGNDTVIRLQSDYSDVPQITALANHFMPEKKIVPAQTPIEKKRSPGKRPQKPQLDLSAYPGSVDFELKRCTVVPDFAVDLKGNLQIKRERLTAENISIQAKNSNFTGSFLLQNESEGIALQSSIKGGKRPLNIRPLTELLLGYPMKELQGTISNIDSRIHALNDGGEGGWLNSLNGSVNADFQNLRIPSNLSTGPFGRLLLFPVDVAAHLVGYLPNDLENWKARFSLNQKQNYSGVGVLRFDQGNVRLRCEAGRMSVDYCRFLGPSVKRLTFEGDVELRDQQNVNLKARLSAIGGQLLIPIAGTLSDPELNWRSIATDPAVEVLRKIRDLKVIGMNHQHHEKDEPLIVVNDLPISIFLKKVHGFFAELFQ